MLLAHHFLDLAPLPPHGRPCGARGAARARGGKLCLPLGAVPPYRRAAAPRHGPHGTAIPPVPHSRTAQAASPDGPSCPSPPQPRHGGMPRAGGAAGNNVYKPVAGRGAEGAGALPNVKWRAPAAAPLCHAKENGYLCSDTSRSGGTHRHDRLWTQPLTANGARPRPWAC